ILKPTDSFVHRHIGPNPDDIQEMLSILGLPSLDALIDATIPADIRLRRPLTLGPHRGEHEVLARLRALAGQNKVFRSFIGMGYYDCITPPVIRLEIVVPATVEFARGGVCGLLLQYPSTDGCVRDYRKIIEHAHAAGALAVVATDLLALTILRPPGEFDADIAVGSSQRFGVPLGFGGPHAAFMATKNDYKRQLPGRLVGVSKDAAGKRAL